MYNFISSDFLGHWSKVTTWSSKYGTYDKPNSKCSPPLPSRQHQPSKNLRTVQAELLNSFVLESQDWKAKDTAVLATTRDSKWHTGRFSYNLAPTYPYLSKKKDFARDMEEAIRDWNILSMNSMCHCLSKGPMFVYQPFSFTDVMQNWNKCMKVGTEK